MGWHQVISSANHRYQHTSHHTWWIGSYSHQWVQTILLHPSILLPSRLCQRVGALQFKWPPPPHPASYTNGWWANIATPLHPNPTGNANWEQFEGIYTMSHTCLTTNGILISLHILRMLVRFTIIKHVRHMIMAKYCMALYGEIRGIFAPSPKNIPPENNWIFIPAVPCKPVILPSQ